MKNTPKPFADSCEQNKLPILDVLRSEYKNCVTVLEIGSGTGQHAVFFTEQLPWLIWQTSEVKQHHAGIQAWIDDTENTNVLPPVELDVTRPQHWPKQQYDAVFSANTVHIMSWQAVEKLFEHLPQVLNPGAIFCLYGPFNYNGQFTSESNARFDHWLKSQSAERGIRDFEQLNQLAHNASLTLLRDHEMPANNRILVWQFKQ